MALNTRERGPRWAGTLTAAGQAAPRPITDRMGRLCRVVLLVFSCGSALPRGTAEEPSVSYIFPAGGQRGTRVEFKVGGHYLLGSAAFEMLGPGVTSTPRIFRTNTVWFEGPLIPHPASQQAEDYPKDYAGAVRIAADAPLGPRSWRVGTSQGVTASRPFVVGDLPEITETEIDGPAIPVPVEVPVTINGRIFPREDVDAWSVSAHAGEEFVCDVQARRIGSPLEARLEVIDSRGHRVAEAVATTTREAQLSFKAPFDGLYQVRIQDINTGGLQHYVYRLSITRGPMVESIFPLGGRSGTRTRFQLTGAGLSAKSAWLNLRTDTTSYSARFEIENRLANPVPVEVGNLPEHLEPEPGSQPPGAVETPTVLNGRIGVPGEVDTWLFRAAKDQLLELDVRARRLGSPLNSVLTVLDSAGTELAKNDDLSGEETDSRLVFKAPADGTYVARVEERYRGRGGPRFGYRLKISPPPLPNFVAKLAANALNVVRDEPGLADRKESGRPQPKPAQLRIDVERVGGFNGPIEIVIEGLPKGVSVKGTTIAESKNETELVFTATPETAIAVSHLVIRARATLAGSAVDRVIFWPGDLAQDALSDVALAVAMPTPFRVHADYLLAYGQRGSLFRRHFLIDRRGHVGPLAASLADRQFRHLQGVVGPTVSIPPNASSFIYPISLPPWMDIGRTSRSAVMVSGFVTDGDGTEHEVCFSSAEQNEQIIAVVAEGLMRVDADRRSVVAITDGQAEVNIKVQRDKSILDQEVALELELPKHFKGVKALPARIAAGESEAILKLQFEKNRTAFNMPGIVRATTLDAHNPHVAETSLEFVNLE